MKNLILIIAIVILSVSSVYSSGTKKKQKSFWDKLSAGTEKKKQPTIVAGVRGIDEPEGVGDSSSRDWVSLEKIEKFSIRQEDIERFVSEGGLK